jgi:hypothetical protein
MIDSAAMSLTALIARLKDAVGRLGEETDALQKTSAELNILAGNGAPVASATPSALPIHEHYKIFRDYVEHEDTLVNNRLLWNINIQGFLFATYGLTIQRLAELQASHSQEAAVGTGAVAMRCLALFLPVLGTSISYLSWRGVKAAQNAIARLEGEWDAVPKPPGGPSLPGLTGGGKDANHREGFLAPRYFPWIFVVAWLALLVAYLAAWVRWKCEYF